MEVIVECVLARKRKGMFSIWFSTGKYIAWDEQLTANRALTEALKAQAIDVKGQSVHSGVGFPLRRFNIDITDEQFSSELERFASHLVLENQNLAYENKQLNLLLKEYEQTLEGVMSKFRGVCVSFKSKVANLPVDTESQTPPTQHAATQHELTLHQYYTSLLQQIQTTHSTSALHDSTTLSTLLQRLSTLIRAALRTVNGEDEEFEHPGFDMPVTGVEKPYSLADVLADIQNIPTTSSPINRPRTGTGTQNRWLGDQGVSGGYAGKSMARLDWSIEREGEIIRLEEENRLLREMLGVSKDFEPQTQQQEQDQQQQRERQEQSPSPREVQVEEQTDQSPSVDAQEHHEQNATAETVQIESSTRDDKPKEEIEGYRVLDKDDARAASDSSNVASRPNIPEETEKTEPDTSSSAITDDDQELPGSPPLTAAASLVRSLSTSPQSRFKASPKLLKSATYSGGTPKSPSLNRSNASSPTIAQSSASAGVSGPISNANPSLSSIFPRQAKTEPTTATTMTVELEDTDVAHASEVQKSGSTSVPTKAVPNLGSTNAEERPVPRSKIEIKKAQPPSLPGSPLGKTPPKTGITLDHAVESRNVKGTTDDSSSHAQKEKTSTESGQKGRKTKAERRRDSQAAKKVDAEQEQKEEKNNVTDEQPKGEDTKPSYAEVTKEDGEE
ncbi:hypothetical protein QFC22_004223 [Naganishia vaughanmartiniae]|uniref:Uncharacterized protein n=1 Tax=Naganishia vaughanmartiniae TaxID=1424756 RepID=A0ACC2X338_9TREE|nr:hypothetical protein QFC22_004223 [Naganishia vaughanmartiniae]